MIGFYRSTATFLDADRTPAMRIWCLTFGRLRLKVEFDTPAEVEAGRRRKEWGRLYDLAVAQRGVDWVQMELDDVRWEGRNELEWLKSVVGE